MPALPSNLVGALRKSANAISGKPGYRNHVTFGGELQRSKGSAVDVPARDFRNSQVQIGRAQGYLPLAPIAGYGISMVFKFVFTTSQFRPICGSMNWA
jgi:hypothetical protein